MNSEQSQQVDALLQRAELDEVAQDLMRKFFISIEAQPQFNKIVSLLERFPSVFENFCKCFAIKTAFREQAKSDGAWTDFIAAEDQVLNKLKD